MRTYINPISKHVPVLTVNDENMSIKNDFCFLPVDIIGQMNTMSNKNQF